MPRDDGPIIEFKDVCLSFGKNQVLKNTTFEIMRGEIFVIVGYSGTGKSVTLQAMVGLLTPQSGSIKVAGQQIIGMDEGELREARKRFGFCFQSGALINWLTVGENVDLPLREHTALPPEQRAQVVKKKLEVVAMADAADKHPDQISGGMKKRAALARAIALDPEIVLFDEPTSGLDPVIAAQIDDLICELNEKLGITCVVVSHDLESVFAIADRIGFFHQGGMYFIGTPDEMRASKDPEVHKFITAGREGDGTATRAVAVGGKGKP